MKAANRSGRKGTSRWFKWHETRGAGGTEEGAARIAHGTQAVHRGLDASDRMVLRGVGDGPLLAKPVMHLLDSAKVLDVAFRRHDERDGFAPVNFDQGSYLSKRS